MSPYDRFQQRKQEMDADFQRTSQLVTVAFLVAAVVMIVVLGFGIAVAGHYVFGWWS